VMMAIFLITATIITTTIKSYFFAPFNLFY